MRNISLDATPNQELSVTLGGNRWDITIKETNGVMCCTLVLNDVEILSGQRIVAGSPLIPYRHLQGSGNFWILTEGDELPYYTEFGVSQQLVYMSVAEFAAAEKPANVWPDTYTTYLLLTEDGFILTTEDGLGLLTE
jgi:hypothetical protein